MSTSPGSDDYDIAEMLTSLGTGEAAVTVLPERGSPTPWRGRWCAPALAHGAVDPAVMEQAVAPSPLSVEYGRPVDRDSAYERLAARLAPPPSPAPTPVQEPEPPDPWPEIPEPDAPRRRSRAQAPSEDDVVGKVLGSAAFRSFARSAASALGREFTRGIFGNRRRRR